ncbi:dTDP-4-dehydrorhamnose 3,5-epimerase family protein [Actinomadura viridis]|uniref:dTDP-4-dehydrorhamnose 3,5-epimerase family protein n=1 Tax=Actinomadura viridis TaxID=58110 RepID=UPI00369BF3AA
MKVRRLSVRDALAFTPDVHRDERGFFVSPFEGTAFASHGGAPVFPVAQASFSVSRRGAVRGVHVTRTPPGMAKYVYCAHGRAKDIVVDLRVGSPTFGRWDAVELDAETPRAVYVPVGVGHAFAALEDGTLMTYLMSGPYVPANELAVSPVDPELALHLGGLPDPIMSGRDLTAPSLAEARAKDLLPDHASCARAEELLWRDALNEDAPGR